MSQPLPDSRALMLRNDVRRACFAIVRPAKAYLDKGFHIFAIRGTYLPCN
jgi:hypothetical protein